MAKLIEKQGGQALRAPSMREIPLDDQSAAFDFARRLLAGECDVLVLLTGVGFETLYRAMCLRHPSELVRESLARVVLVCRGPKPVRSLKGLALTPAIVAPEPNTSRELVTAIRDGLDLLGKRVFVQEYGAPTPDLLEALTALGGEVHRVPVYAWRLPEDTEPLERACTQLASGELDVALFTSATQLDHLFSVAESLGTQEQIRTALRRDVVVASIGPVTSEALRSRGIEPDTEPEHPKMGQLVSHVAQHWRELLETKRAGTAR